MSEDIGYLFVDPRPDLAGSHTWTRLLRTIPFLEDKRRAFELQKLMWSFRSFGVFFKRQAGGGWVMCPALGERCAFDDDAHFEAMKLDHLGPFAKELQQVFRKMDGYDWSETG